MGQVGDGLWVEFRCIDGDVALEGHDDRREMSSIELNRQTAFDVRYLYVV